MDWAGKKLTLEHHELSRNQEAITSYRPGEAKRFPVTDAS